MRSANAVFAERDNEYLHPFFQFTVGYVVANVTSGATIGRSIGEFNDTRIHIFARIFFHARSNRALLIRTHASAIPRNGEHVFSRSRHNNGNSR